MHSHSHLRPWMDSSGGWVGSHGKPWHFVVPSFTVLAPMESITRASPLDGVVSEHGLHLLQTQASLLSWQLEYLLLCPYYPSPSPIANRTRVRMRSPSRVLVLPSCSSTESNASSPELWFRHSMNADVFLWSQRVSRPQSWYKIWGAMFMVLCCQWLTVSTECDSFVTFEWQVARSQHSNSQTCNSLRLDHCLCYSTCRNADSKQNK